MEMVHRFGSGKDEEYFESGTATVWTAVATRKVLRNEGHAGVSAAKSVNLRVAAGEYESAQLVISTDGGSVTYDVAASDLICGTETIPASNIEIYAAKYLNITCNYEDNGAPLGYYPDAMLPLSAAVKNKENVVAAMLTGEEMKIFHDVFDSVHASDYGEGLFWGGMSDVQPYTIYIDSVVLSKA